MMHILRGRLLSNRELLDSKGLRDCGGLSSGGSGFLLAVIVVDNAKLRTPNGASWLRANANGGRGMYAVG